MSNIEVQKLGQEQIDLIKNTIAKGATNDELSLFVKVCERTGLDPFSRQIYAIQRKSKDKKGNWSTTMQTQISIDGARVVAERSGKYAGQTDAQWCGEDGVWKDVWLEKTPPKACRVGVHRTDFKEPLTAVALWDNYVQEGQYGVTKMWKKMGPLMLAKCAESLALRKAFPQDLSGLYTTDEMQQADSVEVVETVSHKKVEKKEAPKKAELVDAPKEVKDVTPKRKNHAPKAKKGYKFKYGSLKGKHIDDVSIKDCNKYQDEMIKGLIESGKKLDEAPEWFREMVKEINNKMKKEQEK